MAHFGWYAALAGLLMVAFGRRAWPWILAGMLLLAGWDEWHQFALPGRHPGLEIYEGVWGLRGESCKNAID
ncbi:MAG: VanZ family protein [Pseudomonadota bacterium]|nr:VanZ family protein [Pseudomonadota bacterium]